MDLDEQLAHFDRDFDKAWARRLRRMRDSDYKELVRAEARRRLIAGFKPYGDRMFRQSFASLQSDELQEDADAMNYRIGRMAQAWPN